MSTATNQNVQSLTGLNKSQRLANARMTSQVASAPATLNPPFPFTVLPFNPDFFGMKSANTPQPTAA